MNKRTIVITWSEEVSYCTLIPLSTLRDLTNNPDLEPHEIDETDTRLEEYLTERVLKDFVAVNSRTIDSITVQHQEDDSDGR